MVKNRTSVGRKKVEIKRINNEDARQVCLSKRRQGLFNKACELSILCGAMIGVVAFSISGRSFSIGHPSIDAVVNRFLVPNAPTAPAASDGASQGSSGFSDVVRALGEQFTELQGLVEEEMKIKQQLKEAIDKEMDGRFMQWLNAKVYELGQDELQEFYKELQAMKGVIFGNQVLAPKAMQIPRSLTQAPMDMALASRQYQFGRSSSQLFQFGESSSQQYQVGKSSSQQFQFGDSSSQRYHFGESSSQRYHFGESSSQQYQLQFGESSSHPQAPTGMASSLEHQFGEQNAIPMPLSGTSSMGEVFDGFEFDDPLLSDIEGFGGSESSPNNQNFG